MHLGIDVAGGAHFRCQGGVWLSEVKGASNSGHIEDWIRWDKIPGGGNGIPCRLSNERVKTSQTQGEPLLLVAPKHTGTPNRLLQVATASRAHALCCNAVTEQASAFVRRTDPITDMRLEPRQPATVTAETSMPKINLRSVPGWERAEAEPAPPRRGVYTHADLPASTVLYRYMTLKTAELTLRGGAFWMRPPQSWDDPYERWWCEELFRPDSMLREAKSYGICWTSRNRDEPIWRIYMSPESAMPAIRFRTTAGKLIEWANAEVKVRDGKAFLGRVRYWAEGLLLNEAKALRGGPANAQVACAAARALHLKRLQFKLEAEIRLLWIETNERLDDHRDLPLGGLVDQIMIGPTTDAKFRAEARLRLLAAGASEPLLKSSLLYHSKGKP